VSGRKSEAFTGHQYRVSTAFSSVVVARSADIGVEDRHAIGGRLLRRLAIDLVVEDGAHRTVGGGEGCRVSGLRRQQLCQLSRTFRRWRFRADKRTHDCRRGSPGRQCIDRTGTGSREGSWKVRIPWANGKGRFGSGSAGGRPHALRNPFLANTPAEAAHIRQHLDRPIRESASTPSRGDRAFARGARLNGHDGRGPARPQPNGIALPPPAARLTGCDDATHDPAASARRL